MLRSRFIIGSLALLVALTSALFIGPTASQAAAAVCSTVHTTSLSTWDLSQTRAQGHNELVDAGLHIWTESNTSLDKAAGYYPLAVNLSTITSASMNYTNSSPSLMLPGLQIVVDGDGNGSPDGILVGETVYGANWWLSNSAAQFMKDGAPHTGGGNGSNWFGTLTEWATAFPSAKVMYIGYSLGSGAHGDGVIVSMQFGCYLFTFGLPGAPLPEAAQPPVAGFTCRVLVSAPITPPLYGQWLNGSEWADWDGFVVQDVNKAGGIEISLHHHDGEYNAYTIYRILGANGGEIRYFELTAVPGICAEITNPLA